MEIGFEFTNYTISESANGSIIAVCIQLKNASLTLQRYLQIRLIVITNQSTADGELWFYDRKCTYSFEAHNLILIYSSVFSLIVLDNT